MNTLEQISEDDHLIALRAGLGQSSATEIERRLSELDDSQCAACVFSPR